jgi:large subunit ribosomal protein L7e
MVGAKVAAAAAPAAPTASAAAAVPAAPKKRGEWVTPSGIRKTRETLLKRRKVTELRAQKLSNVDANAAQRAASRKTSKGQGKKKKKLWVPAQALVKGFKRRERSQREQAKLEKVVNVQANPLPNVSAEVVLLTRVDPASTSTKAEMVPPKALRLLRELHMEKRHNSVFEVLNSKEKRQRLALLSKFVKIQQPSRAQIHNLLFTRGYARVRNERHPLSDNVTIEKVLGDRNIVCLEDMVHELSTAGPNAEAVASFLWPFRMEKTADLRIPQLPHRKE